MNTFAFFNSIGLALSIVSCYIIINYVKYEATFDNFNIKGDKIYRISYTKIQSGKPVLNSASTFSAVGPTLKEELPEVIDFFRLKHQNGTIKTEDNKNIALKGFFADPSILKILTINIIKGDAETAFFSPNSAIISESAASKLYGKKNPIGQSITLNGGKSFFITAVFADLPSNSHFASEIFFSYEMLEEWAGGDANRSWTWNQFYTYILANDNVDTKLLQNKLSHVLDKYHGLKENNNNFIRFELQPLFEIHLKSQMPNELKENGNENQMYFLIIIGFIIFAIALINYINLSTLAIIERTSEIGIRKVLGASNFRIATEFLLESLFLNLLPVLFALVIIYFFGFALLEFLEVPTHILFNDSFFSIFIFISFFIIVTILTTVFPFLFSYKLKVIESLKGVFRYGLTSNAFKKGIIIFQFLISFILIFACVVVYYQVDFIRSKNLGFNITETIVLPTSQVTNYEAGYRESHASFKNELLKQSFIKSVTITSALPGIPIFQTTELKGGRTNDVNVFKLIDVDNSFLKAFDLELLAGEFFNESSSSNQNQIVINEAAANLLGLEKAEDAINTKVSSGNTVYTIKGVIKNYHHQSLKYNYDPMVYKLGDYIMGTIYIKLDSKNLSRNVETIKKFWNEFFPGNPFHFFSLEGHFFSLYKNDLKFGKAMTLFSLLAILMSVLGLLAFSSVIILHRNKEVGIRKLLGAPFQSIIFILSKDFLILVCISILLAAPLGYLLMNAWLKNFAFRIHFTPEIFILPAILLITLSILTISFNTVKAASISPLKIIRK